ncbi:MAG: 23S rRNA (guanosine(2251)-2'-O)-methyltransferase RlmB [Balneolaceae bacterium]
MSLSNHYIYGKNPLLEQFKTEPGKIDKIFLRKNLRGSYVDEIMNLASQNRIPVSFVPGNKLHEMVGRVSDQGVAALVSPVSYLEFEDWLDDLEPDADTAILLLDEIEDPHNFGAILRSAAAAGITAVLVPKHRQAPVSATVVKTSAGTAGRIPIVRVSNLNQAILELKEHKFWIAGLDQNAGRSIWEMEATVPLAFVIGSEDQGIRKKTGEHCDFHYAIPMQNRVESLNASVSAALICFEWQRRQLNR